MSCAAVRARNHNATALLAEEYNNLLTKFGQRELTIIGNYTILDVVGEGSFGKVYLATHNILGSKVVLKSAKKGDANLARETLHHRKLHHPNIATLYEVIISESRIWLALEYCSGDELYMYLYKHGPLSIKQTKRLFSQLSGALAYIHAKGCVHRDLKLENILLDEQGNAKICDFGFTRQIEDNKLLETYCGTVSYAAPEILKGEKYNGPLADVWSLGVILYSLIYARLPFDEDIEADTKLKILNDDPIFSSNLSSDTLDILQKTLNKDPSKRPTAYQLLSSPFLASHGGDKQKEILSAPDYKPFSTKLERELLKCMKRSWVDVEELMNSVLDGKCDSLSAIWSLALQKELRHQIRKRRQKKSLSLYKQTSSKIRRSISVNSRSSSIRKLRSSSEIHRSIVPVSSNQSTTQQQRQSISNDSTTIPEDKQNNPINDTNNYKHDLDASITNNSTQSQNPSSHINPHLNQKMSKILPKLHSTSSKLGIRNGFKNHILNNDQSTIRSSSVPSHSVHFEPRSNDDNMRPYSSNSSHSDNKLYFPNNEINSSILNSFGSPTSRSQPDRAPIRTSTGNSIESASFDNEKINFKRNGAKKFLKTVKKWMGRKTNHVSNFHPNGNLYSESASTSINTSDSCVASNSSNNNINTSPTRGANIPDSNVTYKDSIDRSNNSYKENTSIESLKESPLKKNNILNTNENLIQDQKNLNDKLNGNLKSTENINNMMDNNFDKKITTETINNNNINPNDKNIIKENYNKILEKIEQNNDNNTNLQKTDYTKNKDKINLENDLINKTNLTQTDANSMENIIKSQECDENVQPINKMDKDKVKDLPSISKDFPYPNQDENQSSDLNNNSNVNQKSYPVGIMFKKSYNEGNKIDDADVPNNEYKNELKFANPEKTGDHEESPNVTFSISARNSFNSLDSSLLNDERRGSGSTGLGNTSLYRLSQISHHSTSSSILSLVRVRSSGDITTNGNSSSTLFQMNSESRPSSISESSQLDTSRLSTDSYTSVPGNSEGKYVRIGSQIYSNNYVQQRNSVLSMTSIDEDENYSRKLAPEDLEQINTLLARRTEGSIPSPLVSRSNYRMHSSSSGALDDYYLPPHSSDMVGSLNSNNISNYNSVMHDDFERDRDRKDIIGNSSYPLAHTKKGYHHHQRKNTWGSIGSSDSSSSHKTSGGGNSPSSLSNVSSSSFAKRGRGRVRAYSPMHKLSIIGSRGLSPPLGNSNASGSNKFGRFAVRRNPSVIVKSGTSMGIGRGKGKITKNESGLGLGIHEDKNFASRRLRGTKLNGSSNKGLIGESRYSGRDDKARASVIKEEEDEGDNECIKLNDPIVDSIFMLNDDEKEDKQVFNDNYDKEDKNESDEFFNDNDKNKINNKLEKDKINTTQVDIVDYDNKEEESLLKAKEIFTLKSFEERNLNDESLKKMDSNNSCDSQNLYNLSDSIKRNDIGNIVDQNKVVEGNCSTSFIQSPAEMNLSKSFYSNDEVKI